MSESTIRFKKTAGFTYLRNDLLRDERLSLRTKGLFAVMASLPPNWDFSVRGLAKITGVCKDTIVAALRQMRDAGYLEIHQQKAEGGRFGGSVYVIDPMPSIEEDAAPCPDFSDTVGKTSSPCPTFPDTEKPDPEKSPQLNKELLSKEISNSPYSPPQGDGSRGKRRKPKSIPEHMPERFEAFWRAYPGGGSRQRAVAAWDKLKPDDALLTTMALALKRQMNSRRWRDGIGIPDASTWLNGERWTDKLQDWQPPDAQPQGWESDPEVM